MLGKNICNMMECRAGEHCLFRSFGLGGLVDDPQPVTRSRVQVEAAKWFPSASVQGIDIERASKEGEFVFKIKVRGS